MDNHNSDFHLETRGEEIFSACKSLSMPFLWKPSTIQIVADTIAPTQNVFSYPSLKSVRPQKHIVVHQPATVVVVVVFNWRVIALQNFALFCQTSKWINHRYTSISSLLKLPRISLPIPHCRLSIFHGTSHSIYTKSNGPNENFAAMSASISQYHILSPLQNRYVGLRVETSNFPDLYVNKAAHDSAFAKLQHTGNTCFSVPKIPDTSAASLSRSTHQPSSLLENHPNSTDLPNRCQIMQDNDD